MLCVHDVSELNYDGHHAKNDRRSIGDGRTLGYEYHPCGLWDPGQRTFLGIVHDTLISAQGPDDQNEVDYDYDPRFECFDENDKERLYAIFRHQCAARINAIASWLPDQHPIHVADREYDDAFIFEQVIRHRHDAIIRAKANRNVQMPAYDWLPDQARATKQGGHPLQDGWTCVNLERVIDIVPLAPYKTLAVDAQNRVVPHGRPTRIAKLSIGACSIRIYRRAERNGTRFVLLRPIDLNMVVIRETLPPQDADPLCWVLFTTLPADTRQQLDFIATCYAMRWNIEEYFKLLKCGYHLERIRLDNAVKVAKLLVILAIAILILSDLKHQLGLPPTGPLDKKNYERLKQAARNPNEPAIELSLRLMAYILMRGGWTGRKADPIGPQILMRGILHTFATLDAYVNHRQLLEELTQGDHMPCLENAYK